MSELIFLVERDPDGGFVAKARLQAGSINTQGDTLEELKAMVKDAIDGYFFDRPDQKPTLVRLHFEEVFSLAA